MASSKITNNGNLITLHRTFTASPTITAPSQFKVGTGTTNADVSDTDLETAVSIDGDNFKDFVTGYPSLDTTNFLSTIRCLLLSTEANGNNISEFGIVNTDGTPLLFSRSTFTAITKDSSTQVILVERDRLE